MNDKPAYLAPYWESWITMDGLLRAQPQLLSDAIEQIRTDAYQRGYDVAEARAESRVALGLPLSRESA